MLLSINSQNPQQRLIQQVCQVLKEDGVIIYPTDTVYGLGCSIKSKKGVERIWQIKNRDPKKPLTLICDSERQIQEYTQGFSSSVFKIVRRILPGPYTLVFNASKMVPKILLTKQKTVGIRWPDHPIALKIVETLQVPILSCSLSGSDRLYDDPQDLHAEFRKRVDLVIDGGIIFAEHSSMIDFTDEIPSIIRKGKGSIDWLEHEE